MSGLFGGSQGKGSPEQVNIPPFMSSGGITPQQQSLADFTYGQDLTGEAAQFTNPGDAMSTMATQGAEGAANTKAQTMGAMSDTNQEAMYQDYTNQVNAEEQSLQNQITLSNQSNSDLSGLAKAAGSLFGSGTGSALQTSSS